MTKPSFGIHWFRRDLRINGNSAFNWNAKKNEGRVLGVFFFDSTFLSRRDFSHARFAFFINTLEILTKDLKSRGGDLLTLDAPPQNGFPLLFRHLKSKPSCITFNRDYEPFARARDLGVTSLLESLGVEVHSERDHLLIEPSEIVRENTEKPYYQIYSAFSRRWMEKFRTQEVQQRISDASKKVPFHFSWKQVLKSQSSSFIQDKLSLMRDKNIKKVKIPVPEGGAGVAEKTVLRFKKKLTEYDDKRDFPGEPGTSGFSIYLKNGSLTTSQVMASLPLQHSKSFLKELIWREFYYHILYHCPRVEKEAFIEKYKNIQWKNNVRLFEAWKEGQTGYPLVDAGMRQLKQTGWMHNRVRMVVASFLTKDLLIDWRWGERYFMETLLDGDLAPNNGGWQWAASTGCDPQPYFRIFNPTLQSLKFDLEGKYIKKYVPERAHLTGRLLHSPISPIVDHDEQKVEALRMYKNV
jgi:deoxyribodipyrimidine photo-lyase